MTDHEKYVRASIGNLYDFASFADLVNVSDIDQSDQDEIVWEMCYIVGKLKGMDFTELRDTIDRIEEQKRERAGIKKGPWDNEPEKEEPEKEEQKMEEPGLSFWIVTIYFKDGSKCYYGGKVVGRIAGGVLVIDDPDPEAGENRIFPLDTIDYVTIEK